MGRKLREGSGNPSVRGYIWCGDVTRGVECAAKRWEDGDHLGGISVGCR